MDLQAPRCVLAPCPVAGLARLDAKALLAVLLALLAGNFPSFPRAHGERSGENNIAQFNRSFGPFAVKTGGGHVEISGTWKHGRAILEPVLVQYPVLGAGDLP